jgi:pseudouridine-5'-monophosphatase
VKLSRPPAAAIFDLDGVLLDTEPLYSQATQEIVGEYGKVYDWSVKAGALGRGAQDSARHVLGILGIPLSIHEYLRRRDARLRQLFPGCPAMPGAREFVTQLRGRGLRLAVATSSDRSLYELKTGRHAWFDLFDAIVCGDDAGVERVKPAPDIFLVAAERLAAEPAACLVFEDAPAGVEAALAAGMQVVALPDPNVARANMAGAHLVASGFTEVTFADLGL